MLTEDEEIQEEENTMSEMFKMKDSGSEDASSSSESSSESSSKKKKKKQKGKATKKGKGSKNKKKKSKKKSKKNKGSDHDGEKDEETKKLQDAQKKAKKAILHIYILFCFHWAYGLEPYSLNGYFLIAEALSDLTKKIKVCNEKKDDTAGWSLS